MIMDCERCGESKPVIEKIDREGRIIYICYDCLNSQDLGGNERMIRCSICHGELESDGTCLRCKK